MMKLNDMLCLGQLLASKGVNCKCGVSLQIDGPPLSQEVIDQILDLGVEPLYMRGLHTRQLEMHEYIKHHGTETPHIVRGKGKSKGKRDS